MKPPLPRNVEYHKEHSYLVVSSGQFVQVLFQEGVFGRGLGGRGFVVGFFLQAGGYRRYYKHRFRVRTQTPVKTTYSGREKLSGQSLFKGS